MFVKNLTFRWAVVLHAFIPSTRVAEAGESLFSPPSTVYHVCFCAFVAFLFLLHGVVLGAGSFNPDGIQLTYVTAACSV